MEVLGQVFALFTGVVMLFVVIASTTTQACMALTLELLPWIVAAVAGFWCTVLFVPGVAVAIFCIFGHPSSYLALIRNAVTALWEEGHGPLRFLGNLITYFLTLVFPGHFFSTIAREPCMLYPPSTWQLERAKVTDEIWIFINGVATTRAVGEANCRLLCLMFGRPIYHLHNPTDSIWVDLIECVVDKVGICNCCWEVEPRRLLIRTLRAELQRAKQENKKRVVLIAHSQGTIITGNALEALGRDPQINVLMRELLEVYCLAVCSHVMPARFLNTLENISNGCDTVAHLGQLFPFPSLWRDANSNPIRIDGARVLEPRLWGHFLNTHYLFPMWLEGRYGESQLVVRYMLPPPAQDPGLQLFAQDPGLLLAGA